MRVDGHPYRSVWLDGSAVRMIDQRLLPHRFEVLTCPTSPETVEAIRTMAVRGAGAIGAAAGFALAQAVLSAPDERYRADTAQAAALIRAARPTARDLFYAVEQVERAVQGTADAASARRAAVAAAQRVADENASAGERIGLVGEPLVPHGARVLTHCNAGWLAFADWGSALAPIYRAQRSGKEPFVYVTETRPRSQGAKLTAWELREEGVRFALVADTACGRLFQQRALDCVIVGADRIAANGDVANKIGTYPIALLAHHHGVPFYVAAPHSTFDLATPDGSTIVVEERGEDEVLEVSGLASDGTLQRVRITVPEARAKNPAFDVTPAAFVRAFITEAGLIPPRAEAIAAFVRAEAPSDA